MTNIDAGPLGAVGQAMVAIAPAGWRRLTVHATAAATMTSVTTVAELTGNTPPAHPVMGTDGVLAVADLRQSMYRKGTGTWYNATITLDASGKITADFDYEMAPFGGLAGNVADGGAEPELLLADQELYPRDSEALPRWHPSRGTV